MTCNYHCATKHVLSFVVHTESWISNEAATLMHLIQDGTSHSALLDEGNYLESEGHSAVKVYSREVNSSEYRSS